MARQSDGRYRAKVTVGKDMNGGGVIKYVSGRTKKDLEAAKEAVRQEFITGRTAQKDALLAHTPYSGITSTKAEHKGIGTERI